MGGASVRTAHACLFTLEIERYANNYSRSMCHRIDGVSGAGGSRTGATQ